MTGGFKIYIDIFDSRSTDESSSGIKFDQEENSEALEKSGISNITHSKPESADLDKIDYHDNAPNQQNQHLCGYLNVRKSNDIVKCRRRWFVFVKESCRLLYFRQPTDIIPRCSIDIANSSFGFNDIEKQKSNTLNSFEIR